MSVELFSGAERLLLLGAAALFSGLAALLAWRRARAPLTAGAVVAAALPIVLLLGEQAVAWLVRLDAPARTDFNEYRWVLLSPWGRVGLLLGVAAACVIVALGWLASSRVRSPWRRAAIVGLRGMAALCALVLLIEPAVELRQVAREPNRIAILADESLSMSLRDQSDGPTRAERARAVLAESGDTLEAWRKKHIIDFYDFDETLRSSSAESLDDEPEGRATLMRSALEELRARYDGADLAGVVLLSDGVATGAFSDRGVSGETREFLRSLDARVHTVWTGRRGLKDVSVAKVLADEFAFVRTVIRVEAIVRSTGFSGRRIPVTLSSEGKPLRRKWIDVGAGQSEAKVAFEFTPDQVGKYVYEISTPVADDEAVAENNSRSFVLRVIRDKIRVLQVAGRPSWDVRALRGMLKQNPNVDLISFFILRTQSDISNAPNSELSLIPFPTHELFEQELPSFDIIVLQNFNYLPYGIAPYLDNIRKYVEGGGGLVMLGGPLSFGSGGYQETPVAGVLPVELPRTRSPAELIDTSRFKAKLTEEGEVHPITALRYRRADNHAAWEALPELEGLNKVVGARDFTSVLATHPSLEGPGGEPLPLIVAGEYGDGRSLAVMTDTLWQWGFVAAGRSGEDGGAYFELWKNAIRWLIRDPDLEHLRVQSDEVSYEPGEPVRLEVQLLSRDYTPHQGGEVTLEVSRGSDPKKIEQVAAKKVKLDDSGEGALELEDLTPGVYRVEARSELEKRKVRGRDIFLVREATAELDEPAADSRVLTAIAEATGGRALGAAEALPEDLEFEEPRIVRVDNRTDIELWSRPWLLLLALAFLGLEWVLRQRSGSL